MGSHGFARVSTAVSRSGKPPVKTSRSVGARCAAGGGGGGGGGGGALLALTKGGDGPKGGGGPHGLAAPLRAGCRLTTLA